MSEEKERNPKLDIKKIVKMNKPVEITLKSAKPIADGEGKYGSWHLWKAEVNSLNVLEPDTNKEIQDYTGDVVFFSPTDKFQEQLMGVTNGEQENVKISVNKEPIELNDGKIVGKWVIKKLGEGEVSSSALTPTEKNLVSDVMGLLEEGYEFSLDEFGQEAKERIPEITEKRIEQLYEKLD
mgnify:CR=1 FL=1